jgi:hypothetical protein
MMYLESGIAEFKSDKSGTVSGDGKNMWLSMWLFTWGRDTCVGEELRAKTWEGTEGRRL